MGQRNRCGNDQSLRLPLNSSLLWQLRPQDVILSKLEWFRLGGEAPNLERQFPLSRHFAMPVSQEAHGLLEAARR